MTAVALMRVCSLLAHLAATWCLVGAVRDTSSVMASIWLSFAVLLYGAGMACWRGSDVDTSDQAERMALRRSALRAASTSDEVSR
jgi:hypothetical protein